MGDKTAIEWTDATWNPVTGCTKVSQGCKFCYAERVFPRAYGQQRIATSDVPGSHSRPRKFTDIVVHHDRLDQPLRWKKPRRIFVNSMSDLFHEAVPFEFIGRVFGHMHTAKQHNYQILTKRPARMREFIAWYQKTWLGRGFSDAWPREYAHVYLGVSCEDQQTADERIPLLLQTPAAVRFVSLEPLLGPIDLNAIYRLGTPINGFSREDMRGAFERWQTVPMRAKLRDGLDWVIVGGESGPNARPMHPDWARSIRDQCQAAGVPFFFKQWGEWIPKKFYSEPGKGQNYPWGVLDHIGHWFTNTTPWNGKEGEWSDQHEYTMLRVGKKAAGAALDGREWKEFPDQYPG